MTQATVPLLRRRWGQTTRRDAWWLQPLVTFVILSAFLVYATWAAFQNAHYTYGPYLSPLYSPVLWSDSPETLHHAWFGLKPAWWPTLLPFSPALIILPFPGLFRLTCYYYRGAYYKAFWADPSNCGVGEPRNTYLGERFFPLVLQNIHRYVLYFALIFIVILSYDAYQSFWFSENGMSHFGIGVGSLVITTNVVCLAGYTLGCHSMRHIAGGFLDRLSGRPVLRRAYACSSCLNRAHMRWAWVSLFVVALTDVYVRLCSMGVITDLRIL